MYIQNDIIKEGVSLYSDKYSADKNNLGVPRRNIYLCAMTFRSIIARLPPHRKRYWRIQLVYFGASCLFLLLFLNLPNNRDWLTNTIGGFYSQWQTLGKKTDVPTRRRVGYGNAYVYTTLIRQQCKPNDYFLIPPQRYLIRNAHGLGVRDGFVWLYPSVLYYHLGQSVHLIDMTAPDSLVQRATHTFYAHQNKLSLRKLTAQNRDSVLADFKRYDPHFFAYTPEQAQAYYRSKP